MPYGTVFGFGGIESRVPRTIESGTAARKGTESDLTFVVSELWDEYPFLE